MRSIHLTGRDAKAVDVILRDSLKDPVGLISGLGYDITTFFQNYDWSGTDFSGSNLEGVSFENSILRGIKIRADQLDYVKLSKPKILADITICENPAEIPDKVTPVDLCSDTTTNASVAVLNLAKSKVQNTLDYVPTALERLERLLDLVDFEFLQDDRLQPRFPPSSCVVLLYAHLLPSVLSLLKRLFALGFPNESIVVIGKGYSDVVWVARAIAEFKCEVVTGKAELFAAGNYYRYSQKSLQIGIDKIQNKCRINREIRRCILVDDDGFLTDAWHRHAQPNSTCDVVSVLQNVAALYWRRNFSPACRVSVARSPAKVVFESATVARGISRKLKTLGLLKKRTSVGLIGLGSIGQSLARLLGAQYQVLGYDINPKKCSDMPGRTSSFLECVQASDVILGCTGRNITHHTINDIMALDEHKSFISVSSRDVEFNSLLHAAERSKDDDPYGTVRIDTPTGASHSIYNGGFPINFDRVREWESQDDVALSRALMLLGILQGLCIEFPAMTHAPQRLMLRAQRHLVTAWLSGTGQSAALKRFGVTCEQFNSWGWWARASS